MSPSNSTIKPARVEQTQPLSTEYWLGLAAILIAFGLLLSAGFTYLAVTQFNWAFVPLAILFGLVALLNIPAIQKARKGAFPLRQMGFVSSMLAVAFLTQATLFKGTGLPAALLFLVYCLVLTSLMSVVRSGTLTITLGLIFSAAISLVGAYSPLALLQIRDLNIFLWAIFVLAILIYAVMQAFQKFFLTLQVRLVTAFIAIVVVSISAGTFVQNQIAIQELQGNTTNNTILTADQVAISLDKFIDTTMKAVQQEALLDPLYRYLEARSQGLPAEQALDEVKTTFRLLQVRETSERVYLSSYALLDHYGTNVFNSTESNIGLSEGNETYFNEPFKSGKPFVSDVTFSSNGYSYIYFSAPIRDLKQKTIGVLRVRYNALVFQRVLETYSGLLGIHSHAILFDDFMLRMADTYRPDLVYASITHLTPEQATELNALKRLPTRPDMLISANQPYLAQALVNSDANPSFALNLDPVDPTQNTQLLEIGGIAKMNLKPWKIVYLQANFDDAALRAGLIRIATLIATLVSVIVGFVSVGLSNVLSSPIKSLTVTAESISRGDLSASAAAQTNDEFGMLGKALTR